MELDRQPAEWAGRPGSILLLDSGAVGASDRLCGELLAGPEDAAVGLVVVTLVQPPAARLSIRESAVDDPPERAVVVTLDSVAEANPDPLDDVEVMTVSDPDNLTRLGVTLTEALSAVEGTDLVFCFHSLSVLLQYAGANRVFRFLSVLTTHLDSVGATAHFHLSPASHDDQTVAALRHLFDEVVTVED